MKYGCPILELLTGNQDVPRMGVYMPSIDLCVLHINLYLYNWVLSRESCALI